MKQREWDIAEIDAVLSFVREKKFNQISITGFKAAWERLKTDLEKLETK